MLQPWAVRVVQIGSTPPKRSRCSSMKATSVCVAGRARPREKDAAAFKISLARRSSAFSRSNALIRPASSVLIPGRVPVSISAWRTQLRSVCAVPIPSFAAIDLIAASRDGYWSTVDRTRRTARSRRSAGYGLVRDITT